jgi:hypothetical protein
VPKKDRADVVRRSAVPQSGFSQKVEVVAPAFAAATFNHATDGPNRPGLIVHMQHFAFLSSA